MEHNIVICFVLSQYFVNACLPLSCCKIEYKVEKMKCIPFEKKKKLIFKVLLNISVEIQSIIPQQSIGTSLRHREDFGGKEFFKW